MQKSPSALLDCFDRYLAEVGVEGFESLRCERPAFDLVEHGVGMSTLGVAMVDAFGGPIAVSIPAPTHCFNDQRDALSISIL